MQIRNHWAIILFFRCFPIKTRKKSLKRCSTARINLILSSIKETRLHRILSLRKENVKSLLMEKLRKLSNMEIVLVNLLCCMALRDQHPWRRWAYAVFGQLIEIHLKKQLQMLFIGNTLKIVRSLKRLSSSIRWHLIRRIRLRMCWSLRPSRKGKLSFQTEIKRARTILSKKEKLRFSREILRFEKWVQVKLSESRHCLRIPREELLRKL